MDKINFFPDNLSVQKQKIILRLDLNVPLKNKVMNIGIDQFGESAPYKEVYNHFGLSEEKIVGFIQKKLRE